MYTFNWAVTAFRSESYIGSATALPDISVSLCKSIRLTFHALVTFVFTHVNRVTSAEILISLFYVQTTHPFIRGVRVN